MYIHYCILPKNKKKQNYFNTIYIKQSYFLNENCLIGLIYKNPK